MDALAKIEAEKTTSFTYETDGIFALTDNQHMRRLYFAYDNCPIATNYKGYMGKVNGAWVITTYISHDTRNEDGSPKPYSVGCYVIPEEYWDKSVAFETSNQWPGISLLENMLYGIIQNFYFETQKNITENSRLIRSLREYIILQDGAPITLSELAAHFGYTPNYLSTLILHETGCRAKFFIDRERVAAAQRFLRYSNLKIN